MPACLRADLISQTVPQQQSIISRISSRPRELQRLVDEEAAG